MHLVHCRNGVVDSFGPMLLAYQARHAYKILSRDTHKDLFIKNWTRTVLPLLLFWFKFLWISLYMGWFHTVPVGIGLNGQTVNIWNGLCTLANHHCLNTMDQIFGSVDELLSTTQVISFIMAKHKIGKISIWKKTHSFCIWYGNVFTIGIPFIYTLSAYVYHNCVSCSFYNHFWSFFGQLL